MVKVTGNWKKEETDGATTTVGWSIAKVSLITGKKLGFEQKNNPFSENFDVLSNKKNKKTFDVLVGKTNVKDFEGVYNKQESVTHKFINEWFCNKILVYFYCQM